MPRALAAAEVCVQAIQIHCPLAASAASAAYCLPAAWQGSDAASCGTRVARTAIVAWGAIMACQHHGMLACHDSAPGNYSMACCCGPFGSAGVVDSHILFLGS
jgi:hypothetical protein